MGRVRKQVRFWIEITVLSVSLFLIGVLGLMFLLRDNGSWSYYERVSPDPSLSFSRIKKAFVNSDNIPEALDSILYCSVYSNYPCCEGGVKYCGI